MRLLSSQESQKNAMQFISEIKTYLYCQKYDLRLHLKEVGKISDKIPLCRFYDPLIARLSEASIFRPPIFC
ncbi:MAG: hypothetical protein HC817_05225 [Saprospiraceae bacterium]|nr:hypothetical protein [Saprospiraceae bacterium]